MDRYVKVDDFIVRLAYDKLQFSAEDGGQIPKAIILIPMMFKMNTLFKRKWCFVNGEVRYKLYTHGGSISNN